MKYIISIFAALLVFASQLKADEIQPTYLVLCSCGEPIILFSAEGAIAVPQTDIPVRLNEILGKICHGKHYPGFTMWNEQRITGKACPISI